MRYKKIIFLGWWSVILFYCVGQSKKDTLSSLKGNIRERWSFYYEPGLSSGIGEPVIPLGSDPAGWTSGSLIYKNSHKTGMNYAYEIGTSVLLFDRPRLSLNALFSFQQLNYTGIASILVNYSGNISYWCQDCYKFYYINDFIRLGISPLYYFVKKRRSAFYIDFGISGAMRVQEIVSGYYIEQTSPFNIFGNMGMGYKVSGKYISWFIEPIFKYAIIPSYSYRSYGFRYYSIGLRTGLMFHQKENYNIDNADNAVGSIDNTKNKKNNATFTHTDSIRIKRSKRFLVYVDPGIYYFARPGVHLNENGNYIEMIIQYCFNSTMSLLAGANFLHISSFSNGIIQQKRTGKLFQLLLNFNADEKEIFNMYLGLEGGFIFNCQVSPGC